MIDRVLEALRTAIEIEHRGHAFYLDAAAQVHNPVAESVMVALAHDEEEHEASINQFYHALEHGAHWPPPDINLTVVPAAVRINAIFAAFDRKIGADESFIGVYEAAKSFEIQTRDFYHDQLESATDTRVKAFFNFMKNMENAHVEMLDILLESTRRALKELDPV